MALKHVLDKAPEAVIAFDFDGNLIALNAKAASLIDQPIQLNSFSRKRQLVKARHFFQLAKEGIGQHYFWIETKGDKPILAFHVILNKIELEKTSFVLASLSNALQEETMGWVLRSLAKINNYQEITSVIDEVLQLASQTFGADYSAVSLIDNQNIVHSVSHFHQTEKKDSISHPIASSPCQIVQQNQSICFFTDVQQQFPKDDFLIKLNINTFLGGPIANTQDQVVGLMTVLLKDKLELNAYSQALFALFLKRINWEIERLLNQRKLQFMASIPQQDPNPVLRILPTGEVIFANDQGKTLLQYWRSQDIKLPEEILRETKVVQKTNQVVRLELAVDGKIYLFTLVSVTDFNQINIYGTDISQLKTTEQDMINLARVDALTQIANRQFFEETLLEKINEHLIENKVMALLLIDLDNFKQINDTLGHPIGDKLLKSATKRMIRCIRKDDFIARLGGDEFIVLLTRTNLDSTEMVAEKIINVLARSFRFGEYHMNITASIGIALYPETGLSTSDLLKHADIAMYQAKKSGKNSYAVFSKTLHFVQNRRSEVIRKELKLAAAKNELAIDYQPLFNINTLKIIGFEALLRWYHPEQGLIAPNEFIYLAEQTGCIHLISQWLVKQALQDFVEVLGKDKETTLSLNVSSTQLNDPRFLESLTSQLLKYQLSTDRIILDISERAISPNYKHLVKGLKKMHSQGFKLCLDNFGNPQIALTRLLALPIDYLKLDHHLLHGIEKNGKHRALLQGIMNLAKELRIEVIQTGVETEKQHAVIKEMGSVYAQGFYYSKPLDINQIQSLISEL